MVKHERCADNNGLVNRCLGGRVRTGTALALLAFLLTKPDVCVFHHFTPKNETEKGIRSVGYLLPQRAGNALLA